MPVRFSSERCEIKMTAGAREDSSLRNRMARLDEKHLKDGRAPRMGGCIGNLGRSNWHSADSRNPDESAMGSVSHWYRSRLLTHPPGVILLHSRCLLVAL